MITILRLGHRLGRDERLSTHCGLIARAFGAAKIIFTGDYDKKLIESVNEVANRWGGPFSATYEKNWRTSIKTHKKKKFCIVHLTMYGLPFQKKIRQIKKKRNILVVIGSEKVPGEVYHNADYNISVTSQPHSEAAALAVFLHEYSRGKEKKFRKAKIKIVPQERGKKVVD
ncbi:MAG: tRNA (cytidine(56)-2'-O)-methyltransferase [Candidatus Aenigmatarchaeota archaeon]